MFVALKSPLLVIHNPRGFEQFRAVSSGFEHARNCSNLLETAPLGRPKIPREASSTSGFGRQNVQILAFVKLEFRAVSSSFERPPRGPPGTELRDILSQLACQR